MTDTQAPTVDSLASAAPRLAPALEQARLEALRRYDVLDTPAEGAMDDLVRLAAEVCGMPTALISLVDEDRQWFKARLGLDVCETTREVAFCAHALDRVDGEVLEVPDARADARFAANSLVTGPPWIRAYAGAPIVTPDGYVLGTLCVIDTRPHRLEPTQRELLMVLARQVMTQLELRRQTDHLASEVASHEVARAQLREARRYLDMLSEHTDVLMGATDPEGHLTMVNAATAQAFGRPAEELLGRTYLDLVTPAAAEVYRSHDLDVLASGETCTFEETLAAPDGTSRSFLTTRFPLLDEHGKTVGVGGVATDVTDQLRVHEELAASEARWRSLVEQMPVAVATFDAEDLRFGYANARAAALCGAEDAAELEGRSLLDLLPQQARPGFSSDLATLLARGSVTDRQSDVVDLTGRQRRVEWSGSLVSVAGRRAVQMELRDVGARTAAAEALRLSEERFRLLWHHSPVGALEAMPNGLITSVNPALAAMLGYRPAELVGRQVSTVSGAGTTRPDALAGLAGEGASSGSTVERLYRHRTGRLVPVLVSLAEIGDSDNRPMRVLATVTDLSERVVAEDNAAKAHAALAERQVFTDALLESIDVGIVACDAAGRLTVFNRASRGWHGLDVDPSVAPDDLQATYDLFDSDGTTPLTPERIPLLRALHDGVVRDAEIVIAPHDRPSTRVLCSGRALRGPSGQDLGAIVAMHDVTELRTSTIALRRSEDRFRTVFSSAPTGLAVLDGQRRWTQANPALCRMLGREATDVTALPDPLDVVHAEDRDLFLALGSHAIADPGSAQHAELRLVHHDGHTVWGLVSVTDLPEDAEGELLLQVQDVTERRAAPERLTRQALYDPVTDLPNRVVLMDRAAHALARLVRHPDSDCAALFVDVSGLPEVRAAHGSAASDHVVQEVARRVAASVRPCDTVTRLGNGEFVVLCEDLPSRAEAQLVADRVTDAVGTVVAWEGWDLPVSVDVTLSFAGPGVTALDLLRHPRAADDAA